MTSSNGLKSVVSCFGSYCNKSFYLKSFRLREAKTVSCMFCNKRFDVTIAKQEGF